jgi:stearoyl-CoA desaturase (delta-9 desaturase)
MPETAVSLSPSPARDHHVRPIAVFGFALVHVAAVVGVAALGLSWKGVALAVASYYLRMFAITAGFHRYFSHKAYRLSRVPQFLLALLGQTSAQKGVLWWASNHRHHHKYSDTPEDIHSPKQDGFWWSHIGWILSGRYDETDFSRIPDLVKFPELVWLDRNQYAPTMLYGILTFLCFGWTGLVWAYFVSTVFLWHGTFTINSLMHVIGRRVFPTTDTSRNSMFFALVTMGEGWHNNHHFYPSSAAQGFRWWQLDASFYLLWIGEKLGVVKNLRRAPTAAVIARLTSGAGAVAAPAHLASDAADALAARWEEIRSAASVAAHAALVELEAARLKAAARLEKLQEDYAAARVRAGAAAETKLDELRAEIDRTRRELHETLQRLVEQAEGLGLAPA